MRTGRYTLGTALLGGLLVLGMLAPVSADNAYETLFPYLIEISGWQAEDPNGMSMNMSGVAMVNAARDYSQNDKRLTAVIMKGHPAAGMAAGGTSDMQMETDEGKVDIKELKGYKVQVVYNKAEQSGAVIVWLDPSQEQGALFTLSYEGLGADEALEITQQFDWTQIDQALKELNPN